MDRRGPLTVDYAGPSAASRRSRRLFLRFWLPQLLTWGALTSVIALLALHVLPNYAATSKHWKINLPAPTHLLLSACAAIHRYRLWIAFPVLPFIVPFWLALRTRARSPARRTRAGLYSSLAAVILMLLVTVLVFYLMLTSRFLLSTDSNDPFRNPAGWMEPCYQPQISSSGCTNPGNAAGRSFALFRPLCSTRYVSPLSTRHSKDRPSASTIQ